MPWEEDFAEVAHGHEGLIAKFHLPAIGCTSTHWWRAVRSGRWEPAGRRVLRAANAPTSDAQRVLAAVLDASPGGVLHGPSALAWLGLPGYHLSRVAVARARGLSGARTTLGHLHQLRLLRPDDVVVCRAYRPSRPCEPSGSRPRVSPTPGGSTWGTPASAPYWTGRTGWGCSPGRRSGPPWTSSTSAAGPGRS